MILHSPLPPRSLLPPAHQVTVVRKYNTDAKTTSRGRTTEEAIARMKGLARDYGYWDWIDVIATSAPSEPAPTAGDDRR